MLGRSYVVPVMAVVLVALLGVPSYVRCDSSLREEPILYKRTSPSRENGLHGNYMFNSNYEELKSISKEWGVTSLRERILPLFLMINGVLYAISNPLPIYPLAHSMEKHMSRITTAMNEELIGVCDKNILSQASLTSCNMSSKVMEMLSLVIFTRSVLMEASIRTRLLSTQNKFTSIPDSFSKMFKESLATEMIILENVVTTVKNLLQVIVARYLQGSIPVPGTENDFVKAADYLYAAISDLVLISKLIYSHTIATIAKSEDTAWVEQDIMFATYIISLIKRGIPSEYDSSPFPPLSYFWDMTGLDYAVSLLADMGSLINRTLEDHEGTEGPLIDTELVSIATNTIRTGHNGTLHYLKKNDLQNALYSATDAARYGMASLRKAGLPLRKDETWEELKNHFLAIVNKMKPTKTGIVFQGVHLHELISKATLPGVLSPAVETMRTLYSYEITPSDYNSMITMVTKVSSILAQYTRTWDTSAWPTKSTDEMVDEPVITMDMFEVADPNVKETSMGMSDVLEAILGELDDELREKIGNDECEDPDCILAVIKMVEEMAKSSLAVHQLSEDRELPESLNANSQDPPQ